MKSVKQENRVLVKLQELCADAVCGSTVTGTYEERFFIVMEVSGEPRMQWDLGQE